MVKSLYLFSVKDAGSEGFFGMRDNPTPILTFPLKGKEPNRWHFHQYFHSNLNSYE